MARKNLGDSLVLQVNDGQPEVYENIESDEVRSRVAKLDSDFGRRLDIASQRLDAIEREVVSDPDRVVEYYLFQARRAEVDQLLSRDMQEDPEDRHRGRIEEYERFTSLGTVILYQHINYSGAWRPYSATWPNFGWWPYSFNDRASSAKAWGGNILFEHSWYRGRRLYLIGLPYVQFPDFTRFGFNDIASSYAGF